MTQVWTKHLHSHVQLTSYIQSRASMWLKSGPNLCNLAAANGGTPVFGPKIVNKGLWFVRNINLRPKRYEWNFFTMNTMDNASFQSVSSYNHWQWESKKRSRSVVFPLPSPLDEKLQLLTHNRCITHYRQGGFFRLQWTNKGESCNFSLLSTNSLSHSSVHFQGMSFCKRSCGGGG